MKVMDDKIYKLCEFLEKNPNIDIKSFAKENGTRKKVLIKNLSKYKNYKFYKDGKHYFLSQKELDSIKEYTQSECSLTMDYIQKKYKTKSSSFIHRLQIFGYDYKRSFKCKFNRNAFDKIQTEEDAY